MYERSENSKINVNHLPESGVTSLNVSFCGNDERKNPKRFSFLSYMDDPALDWLWSSQTELFRLWSAMPSDPWSSPGLHPGPPVVLCIHAASGTYHTSTHYSVSLICGWNANLRPIKDHWWRLFSSVIILSVRNKEAGCPKTVSSWMKTNLKSLFLYSRPK